MIIEQIGAISILRFPPRDLVIHGVPDPLKAQGFIPSTAAEALSQDPSLFAVLDGPMFEKCSSGSYATYTCGDPRFLLKDSDTQALSDEPGVGGTIFVKEGEAHFIRGGVLPEGIELAVQGYPSIVENAQNTAGTGGTNQDRVWRAALCIWNTGDLVFAVGQDTMPGFASSLIAAGATFAVYTDGGGSGRLATRDGFFGSTEDRRVPLWLGVRPSSALSGAIWPIIGVTALVVVGGAFGYLAYRELKKAS